MELCSLLGAWAGALAGWGVGIAWFGVQPWRLAWLTSLGVGLGVLAVPSLRWLTNGAIFDQALTWLIVLLAVGGLIALVSMRELFFGVESEID